MTSPAWARPEENNLTIPTSDFELVKSYPHVRSLTRLTPAILRYQKRVRLVVRT